MVTLKIDKKKLNRFTKNIRDLAWDRDRLSSGGQKVYDETYELWQQIIEDNEKRVRKEIQNKG